MLRLLLSDSRRSCWRLRLNHLYAIRLQWTSADRLACFFMNILGLITSENSGQLRKCGNVLFLALITAFGLLQISATLLYPASPHS